MNRSTNTPAARSVRPVRIALRVVAAVGLVYDGVSHLQVAVNYDGNRGALVAQGDLFRMQAAVAILAALLVLLVRHRWTDVFALLVAASAVAAVVTYRFADLGPVAGLPDMFEPIWYPEKLLSLVAELLASLALVVLLLVGRPAGANRNRFPGP
jgi:hypothetical protein